MNGWVNEQKHGLVDGWIDMGWVGQMNGWQIFEVMDGETDGSISKQMSGQICRWMDEQKHGMDGCRKADVGEWVYE